MTVKIGFLSQKGGVYKSSLSRTTAIEYAKAGWDVKIGDFNTKQSTSYVWNSKRLKNEFEPLIQVEQFHRVNKAVKIIDQYDLFVFDGSPDADVQTNDIAELCDLVVLPTGLTSDDLVPQVILANEFVKKGINRNSIVFVLTKILDSNKELESAKNYIERAGYEILEGNIQVKTGYASALDIGKCLTETSFSSLNSKADLVIQSIMNKVQSLT